MKLRKSPKFVCFENSDFEITNGKNQVHFSKKSVCKVSAYKKNNYF